MMISAMFNTRQHVASSTVSKTGTFWHSSNHISRSQSLLKYLSYEDDVSFQNAQIFLEIPKTQ